MNVDALLGPIAGDDQCGVDLSFSSEFDAIQESRRADDPTLGQGEWKKPLKSADWPAVALQCEALLGSRTQDLRVAAWLADAWARTRGFAGLADGLLLCARLCETWWDAGLHPRPDGDDMAPRIGSLEWLLGQVVAVAIAGPDADAGALQRAVDALARLQAVVDARLGDEGPAFGAAVKLLQDARGSVGAVEAPDAVEPAATSQPTVPGGHAIAGPLQTRAQALQQLRGVADFFRRTEPHSPVAYLADKAAAWGEMPLHVWLRTVLKDPGALDQIEDLLGVPRPPA